MAEDNRTWQNILSSSVFIWPISPCKTCLTAFSAVSSWRAGPFSQETPLTLATRLSSQPKHSPALALHTPLSQPYLAEQPHIPTPIFSPASVTQLCKPFVTHTSAMWERTRQSSHPPAMQLGSHLFNILLHCCLHKNQTP